MEGALAEGIGAMRQLSSATKLNGIIRQHSTQAAMVMLSMPAEPLTESAKEADQYLRLLEEYTKGLDKVLMIRGSGSEVVTIFN